MAITKRPCANCPFRSDGAGVALAPGRIEGIISKLRADDHKTFVCHKSLDRERMTCAGAVAVMSKLGKLPVIARLGLAYGVIAENDILESAKIVIDPPRITPHKSKLHLNLKAEYFDQIKAGEKQHELRLQTAYWSKRLAGQSFQEIILKSGYPKAGDDSRVISRPWRGYELKEITHPHFGPNPVKVFAIRVNE